MKVFLRVVRLIAITGLLAMPYSAAHAWGGWGPWGNNHDGWGGSDWGPFDMDGFGDFELTFHGSGRGSGYGRGYNDYYGSHYGYGGPYGG